MAALVKTFIVLALIGIIPAAVAQSGRPMNSTETAPGTSVPVAPTDAVRPAKRSNDGTVLLNGSMNTTQELDKDAGASKDDRKASRKNSVSK